MERVFQGSVGHARGGFVVADSDAGIGGGGLLWKAYGEAGSAVGSLAGRGFVGAGDTGCGAEGGEGSGAGELLVDVAEFAHEL